MNASQLATLKLDLIDLQDRDYLDMSQWKRMRRLMKILAAYGV